MDSVNSPPPNRSKSNPSARINRLLIVTICIIVVVFLEGSIFQSTVLGKEFRGNLQGVILFSILVFSSVSCQILFLIQVRSLIKSGMSNDGLYSRIWFFIKSVQSTIVIILLLITIQIILTASYYLPTVLILVGASNVPAIALFVLLIIKLARWSKTNSDYTVFGFMVGIASIAINLFFMTLFLFDTPKILHSTIDASRCGLMCYSLGSVFYPAYSITYLISVLADRI